jgi:hypothetical protein
MRSIGNHDIVLMLSSSQNQFYSQINESFKIIFMIRNSIDYSKFETQRSNFEFWDELVIYLTLTNTDDEKEVD